MIFPDIHIRTRSLIFVPTSKITEPYYEQVSCNRAIDTNFTGGIQYYAFDAGSPEAWIPSKSYFLIKATLTNLGGTAPLLPSALTAFSDNMAGGLWDNITLQGGSKTISKCEQMVAQTSALDVRLNNTFSKLKSMGNAVHANEASFQKRLLACASYPVNVASSTGSSAYDERDVYKPTDAAATFATATVQILAEGKVTGTNTLFQTGMPLGSLPTTGSVLKGDILVVNGIPYTVNTIAGENGAACLIVQGQSAGAGAAMTGATADWFIVRADTIRTPQTSNSIEVVWQPPLGIMKCNDPLSHGRYQFVMTPNSTYRLACVETKNPNWETTFPYKINIDEVFFYAYKVNLSVPEGPTNLFMTEYVTDVRPFAPSVSFEIPTSTKAITVFVQDNLAGLSPLVPPSMFKYRTNADLYLTTISVKYAGQTKPLTVTQSKYLPATVAAPNYINQLQQRYRDSYYESGMDPNALGCESYTDWLKRGPFYHFNFAKDKDNNATTCTVNMSFSAGGAALSGNAQIYLVAHKSVTAQLVTAGGNIVSCQVDDI